MTPQGNNNNNIGGNTTTQASQPAVDYDSDAAVVTWASIIIKGCGTKEANGTYKYKPKYNAFSQSSRWQGKEAEFSIAQKDGYWSICLFEVGCTKTTTLYMTSNQFKKDDLPSTADWMTLSGECPSPQSIQFDYL